MFRMCPGMWEVRDRSKLMNVNFVADYSVLFVTHSIEEALQLSDRILLLSTAPATVIREITVPFNRPSTDSLWSDPTFNELKREIYEMLKP